MHPAPGATYRDERGFVTAQHEIRVFYGIQYIVVMSRQIIVIFDNMIPAFSSQSYRNVIHRVDDVHDSPALVLRLN